MSTTMTKKTAVEYVLDIERYETSVAQCDR